MNNGEGTMSLPQNENLSDRNKVLILFYMGRGVIHHPWLFIVHSVSVDAPKGLIFHEFVPYNIGNVLERPFLKSFMEICKIFASIFSRIDPTPSIEKF